jgi:hypothetical protein
MPIKFEIDFVSQKCNHWPYIKIHFNGDVLYDQELESKTSLFFNLSPIENHNTLTITHYNKKQGEMKIWDTKTNSNGDIIEDCNFQIIDLKIDGIPFNISAYERFLFNSTKKYDNIYLNSIVGFNGEFNINFPKDVYSWLTVIKYKKDIVDNLEQFSNTSQLFYYEEDQKLIKEIKELLNLK